MLGLVVNVSVNLVMIPIYGKEGAAATTALTEADILLAGLVFLSRYMGDSPSFWVAGRLLPVAGVSAVAAYALPLPWIAEMGVVAMLFGVGVAAVRVVSPGDIAAMLRRRPPSRPRSPRRRRPGPDEAAAIATDIV